MELNRRASILFSAQSRCCCQNSVIDSKRRRLKCLRPVRQWVTHRGREISNAKCRQHVRQIVNNRMVDKPPILDRGHQERLRPVDD
jgi:hypothetical protein